MYKNQFTLSLVIAPIMVIHRFPFFDLSEVDGARIIVFFYCSCRIWNTQLVSN